MADLVRRYLHWLHLRWPAGRVEKLPLAREDGSTNIPGIYIVGDLRGMPLLKFSADTGARAVRTILEDRSFEKERRKEPAGTPHGPEGTGEPLDLVIIGAGISGISAALEAKKAGLSFAVVEASEPFSTIANFPKGKAIFTYPRGMKPAGDLELTAVIKEELLDDLKRQTIDAGIKHVHARAEYVRKKGDLLEVVISTGGPMRARRVIAALGRSGNFRKLGVPGEDLNKVYNRLHDPKDFCDMNVLVVGGGDSAAEAAIALALCGAGVTLSYRKKELSRPKEENLRKLLALAGGGATGPAGTAPVAPEASRNEAEPELVTVESPTSERVTTAAGTFVGRAARRGRVRLALGTEVSEIMEKEVILRSEDGDGETLPNDVVFTMIGREAPLEFFRRSGIRIAGDWTRAKIASFAAFFLFSFFLYNWKSHGSLTRIFEEHGWFPFFIRETFSGALSNPETLPGTLVISASMPSFWYTLAFSILVVAFGIRRIRRRKTPYITLQTSLLASIQVFPLFILPEIILPLLGHNGLLPQWLTGALFPPVSYGHGYEFWRAYGLILAWPLMVYNVFTNEPIFWWLVISFFQTFIAIPVLVYFFGKGVYCGWICSCGALAETLGDGQRHKMPHGPAWSRLNVAGQLILLIALSMLALRIVGWTQPPDASINRFFDARLQNYKWIVDVFLAGIVGYGVYFWLSGRTWCRFFCPLAALMHIYARASRFRIIPDKEKCISCNLCTSMCHMGIDVMNFANKGIPMEDPECVRCSACVHVCPTGVLSFGQVDKEGRTIVADRLGASPVRMREAW